MDFLKSFSTWQLGVGALLFAIGAYLVFWWLTKETSGFLDLGEACNPQIENTCGENAHCQADETGEKGICFPKEEETENVSTQ